MKKFKWYLAILFVLLLGAFTAFAIFKLQTEPEVLRIYKAVEDIESRRTVRNKTVNTTRALHPHDEETGNHDHSPLSSEMKETSTHPAMHSEELIDAENPDHTASFLLSDAQLKAIAASEAVYKQGLADRQTVLRYEKEFAEHNQKVFQYFDKLRAMDAELEQLIPLESVDTLNAYIEGLSKEESKQLLLKLEDFQLRHDQLAIEGEHIFDSEPEYPKDAYNRLKEIAVRNAK